MGTDFLRNKRDRHFKTWREGAPRAASDMFAQVTKIRRIVRATSDASARLCVDQNVLLRRTHDGKVVASDGVHQVATVDKPPRALLEKLKVQHDAACGRVSRVNPESGNLELLLED